jgi:hypothetical protein
MSVRQRSNEKRGVMSSRRVLLATLLALLNALPVFATGPSFVADATLKGSSLSGWHTVGAAKWSLDHSVLTGTPGSSGDGGWLVLDRSYQDIGLYAEFKCSGACDAGILFRGEKTPDGGMKGSYVSLNGETLTYYAVTVDANGKIIERTPLPRGGGQMRIAPPPNPNGTRQASRPPGSFNPYEPAPGVSYPFLPPGSKLSPDKWNAVELMFDANILRGTQNNGEQSGAVADSDGYGPIALYAGGSGAVQFQDLAYTDLNLKYRAPDETSSGFMKQTLSDFYYSWGAAAADFNHDGILDVVSGPYIYLGPDFTHSREIYLGQTSNPSTEYADNAWMEFAADFAGDAWPDVLTCKFGGATQGCYLYVNARGEPRRWDVHRVIDKFDSEIAVVRDIDGNGRPALVYSGDGYVRYAEPDPADVTKPWIVHNVSERGYGTAHGIGAADINGDGRMDILNAYGWWEQPRAGSSGATWTYHPVAFARYGRGGRMGGSVMAVYDVNGDGLNDVVTVLDAHGWGLAWFEQKRDAEGNISFVPHEIMDDFSTKNAGGVTFSEAHGDTYADIDGDGIPDFIVGKRYWSHRDDHLDANPYGTPVLYWYQTVRDAKAPGGARFVPHLIDNRSGAGSDILAVDLNRDGKVDVVTATRFGTFIFWNKMSGNKQDAGVAPAE